MEDKGKRQNYSFIHSIFQFLIHCDRFKDFIFNNSFYDAPIITNFISLFYCYNEEMKKRDKKKKIVPEELKKEMDKYLENNEDPITFLDKIFEILHSYILTNGNVNEFENKENLKKKCEPVCNIHELFNIDINFNEICSHCKSSNTIQNCYDHNFYFTINISDTLKNILAQNFSFQNLYNNLFQISTMNLNKKCPSCKNDTYEKSLICYSVQDYFIINLEWDKYNITKENLIKIYCMINSQMNTKNIFYCDYNENYTFFGMIVCQKNNYLNVFYETENNNNCFVVYNYPEKKNFKYLELLNNLIKYKLYPIALFYQKKNYDENFFFEINEQVYQSMINNINKKKNNNNQFIDYNINNREEVNNDIKNNSKIINNFSDINEGKWRCNKCKTENLNSKNKCENCGGTNKIKQKDNLKNWWICQSCQTNNSSTSGKCQKCGNVNILISSIIKYTKNQEFSENIQYVNRNIYNEDKKKKNEEYKPEVKNYNEEETNLEQKIEDNEKNNNEYNILNDNENINDIYSNNENNNYSNNEDNNFSDNEKNNQRNNNFEIENNNNENNVDKDNQNLIKEEDMNQQTDYMKEFNSEYFHKSNQQN